MMETPDLTNPGSTLGRLLIVDDEVKLMTALRDTLAQQGYETTGASSARKALEALGTGSFDVMLTDLVMPEMDGIALLREAIKKDPYLVGIIMTGHATVQSAVEAMKVGAFDFVLKPFKLSILLPTLNRAMQVRRLRLENVQLREMLAVYELSMAVAFTLDSTTILNKVADAVVQACQADEVSILLPTADGRSLYVAVVRGEAREHILGHHIDMGGGIAGWVAANRKPLSLEGEVCDPRFQPVWPRSDIRSSISIPMLAGGNLVGVLNANAIRRRAFTLGEIKALNILIGISASALQSARFHEQVKEAEARYRNIFENAVEGIFQTGEDGRFLAANSSLARMLGHDSPDEMIRTVADIASIYADGEGKRMLGRVFANGEPIGSRHEFIKADGSRMWVDVLYSPLKDESGAVMSAIVTVRDVTDVMELRRQLNQSQKMEAIGTLAGGIAHDFNNILGVILGYTELVALEIPEDSPIRGSLGHILGAARRAKELVKQILTFSRRSDQELRPLRIVFVIKEALKLLRSALPSTIEIRLENKTSSPGGDSVLADPTQVHQVVMNLCGNAEHAMREKGGTLEVSLVNIKFGEDDKSRPPDLEPGDYVRLTVGDTGPGISADVIERIFEPYFTTKQPGEGTGLGLSVVHGIVKSHRGSITVNSRPGLGTSFHVFFPRWEKEAQPETASESVATPIGDECILFVDDEEALAEWGKRVLEHLGYSVVAVTSGSEVLDEMSSQPDKFDMVITDQTMPGLKGTELAKEILRIRPDIPIILCTGSSDAAIQRQAEESGIRELLMKPLIVRELAEAVRRVLDEERRESS